MTDPFLALGWLVVAHLVADFVLQTDGMAAAKRGPLGRALRTVAGHVLIVAACLLPFVLAFGLAGLWALLAIAAVHAVLDLAKGRLTGAVDARAARAAADIHEPAAEPATLGNAWTAVPAALFVLDQLGHGLVLFGAWWTWLRDTSVTAEFAGLVNALVGNAATGDVNRIATWSVVLVALLIVNVRAGSIFVALLLRPGGAARNDPLAREAPLQSPPPAYRIRLGPIDARVAPEPPVRAPTLASPARVGAAIGVLERLLIVAFVLARADAAIGLVIAAKTLARFKQLDDRDFAEYYLLGTLGSVAVGVISAIVARAVLAL